MYNLNSTTLMKHIQWVELRIFWNEGILDKRVLKRQSWIVLQYASPFTYHV
jgi:hypothetical protein